MAIPEDPYMLLSFINMKLRDGEYETLEELCESLDCRAEDIKETLKSAGFDYMDSAKQFR